MKVPQRCRQSLGHTLREFDGAFGGWTSYQFGISRHVFKSEAQFNLQGTYSVEQNLSMMFAYISFRYRASLPLAQLHFS
jgi:hypothetical protein